MFPAQAGMSRQIEDGIIKLIDVPRTSGDEPFVLLLNLDEK